MILHVIIALLIISPMKTVERDLLLLLHDVARLTRTRFDQWARGYGLTRAQGVILVRLSRQPGLSQNELAALCEVEPITVGRLVDRLEMRGLLERRLDPGDRRIRRLHLLPASEPILAKIQDYKEALGNYLTDGLSPQALETMVDALLHVKQKLTVEPAGPLAAAGE